MENTPLSLVTGANGHLGNNLVRTLLNKGINVRASVRDLSNTLPFNGLKAELVKADITDKKSMVNALEGVHTFYAVGASFKLWAIWTEPGFALKRQRKQVSKKSSM
jgi:dihydroflavonol-4-reductase